MKLRIYQREAIDLIEGAVGFGEERVCLAAPTSFGKTITAAKLIEELVAEGKNIVFMMNLSALVKQTASTLDSLDVKYYVVAASWKGKQYGPGAKVNIAMQQTLWSRIDEVELECDVLFIDEIHISYDSETMKGIIRKLKPKNIVGLSGTPIDENGMMLKGIDLVQTATVKSLTKDGFLTPVKTYVTKFSQQIELPEGSAEWTAPELDTVLNTPEYNEGVVEAWNRLANGKKTIVFVPTIDHAMSLALAFGVDTAMAFHSGMTQKYRDNVMKMHKDGVFPVLVSVMALAVGYDAPDIECGIMCRPTKTLRLYLQCVGRIMRLFDGKDEAIWIDAAKVTETHGLYDIERDFTITNLKDLKAEKKKNSVPEINYIANRCKDDAVIITLEGIEAVKDKIANDSSLEGLLTRYDISEDMRELLILSSKINNLIGGQKLADKQIDWILKEVEPAIEEFGLKPFKTRLKNIIKKGTKPAALKFFPAWLREQRRF